MNKIDTSNLPLVINIESKDYTSEDSEWQEECRKLYMRIKNALDEGTVEPIKVKKEDEGHRGPVELEMFHTIMFYGVHPVINEIFSILKTWLENRKGAEVILKFADGSELKVSGASKEVISSLYEKHIAKQGK